MPQTDSIVIPGRTRSTAPSLSSGSLTLADHDELRRHPAAAIARHSRRGWRLEKAPRSDNIDGVIVENQPRTGRGRRLAVSA